MSINVSSDGVRVQIDDEGVLTITRNGVSKTYSPNDVFVPSQRSRGMRITRPLTVTLIALGFTLGSLTTSMVTAWLNTQ